MNDLYYILFYEFISKTQPCWSSLLIYICTLFYANIKKWYYIPISYEINLCNVYIVYNNVIIYSNRINLNYYHIRFFFENQMIKMIGNDKYQLINNDNINFYTIKSDNTKFYSVSNKITNVITMYKKPIIKYTSEECCICFMHQGSLIGLCGHQNVCVTCQEELNKCPICNNPHLLRYSRGLI
jgi:hypothetical protein